VNVDRWPCSPWIRRIALPPDETCQLLIGMVGLNELVQIHTGQEMHQSREAFKLAEGDRPHEASDRQAQSTTRDAFRP